MKRLVVLVSGSGTNLQAIMDAIQLGQIEASIEVVISNRKQAYALERAEQANISTLYFPFKPYRDAGKSREDYDADLVEKVQVYQPDLIVLAGWMHIFTPVFLSHFPGQVINLHPALPGQFSGTHAIERAFEAYQEGEIVESGCMMHYVIPEVDAGEVIQQRVVPILPDDTVDSFAERMHQAEHELIVESIRAVLAR